MQLPARERSFYGAAPLVEVICQLRFPKLLALEESLPVGFQAAVADAYPILETRTAINLPLTALLERGEISSPLKTLAYDFFDAARETKITLTSDFVAVTTAKYSNWDEFNPRIQIALNALIRNYDVRFIQRIGLRYQNVIRPSQLGLEGAPSSELLAEELLGPGSAMSTTLKEHQSVTSFGIEGGAAKLRVAITFEGDPQAPVYVVDCDVFNEDQTKVNWDDAARILNGLHGSASHIFRWCIKEPLHAALRPEPCG